MAEEKTKYQELEEQLTYKSKNIWEEIGEEELKEIFSVGDDYKKFLNTCKTERESIDYFVNKAKELGYKNIEKFEGIAKPFDKFYYYWKNKCLALITLGEKDFVD